MDGWWDCEALDQFFERIMAARLDKKVRKSKALLWAALKARLTNMHGRARAFEVGQRPLRYRQRSFYSHAGQAHELLLRLLGRGRHTR